jgi:hypothetical protein
VQSHDLLCPRGGPRGAAGSKLSFNEYGHDDVIVQVQAWAAWLRQKPSLDPKKGGRVPGQPFGFSFGTVTLYHLRFPPLLVINKGTEPEMPSVLLRHCDELCETKTVTWYSVRTST